MKSHNHEILGKNSNYQVFLKYHCQISHFKRGKKKEPPEVLGRAGKIVSVTTHEQCCCAGMITSFSPQTVHPSLRRILSYKPTCRSEGFVSYTSQACQLTKCQTGLSHAAKNSVKPFFPLFPSPVFLSVLILTRDRIPTFIYLFISVQTLQLCPRQNAARIRQTKQLSQMDSDSQ